MVGTEEEEGKEEGVVLGEVLLEKELVEEEGGVLLGMVQLRCGRNNNNNNHHDQDKHSHSHSHMWVLVVVVFQGVNGWVPRLRGRAGPARLVVLVLVLVVVVEEK